MITVGSYGPEIRADVHITAEPATQLQVELNSSVDALYGEQIHHQIREVAALYDNPALKLVCHDSGALPFVWNARLHALFCQALNTKLPFLPPRQASLGSLRRSRLYVPGNIAKFLPNAALYGADAVVLDLEDSVHVDQKLEALALVGEALATLAWQNTEVMVRINEGDRGIGEIRHLATCGVSAFVVPKVESAQQVIELDRQLTDLQSSAMLFPLIESALGVERSFEIASASPRVTAISLGLEDYTADIGAFRTETQHESAYARSRLVNAARAAGVCPLASVYPHFLDSSAVEAYASQAAALGYEGIGCIHPSQIEPIHNAFRPAFESALQAKEIVEAFENASDTGLAVIRIGNRMVDRPTYVRAKRTLSLCEVKSWNS